MLPTIVGRRLSAGMDLYFERHDGEAATIEDFVVASRTTSGATCPFMRWYAQAGTPTVTVTEDWNDNGGRGGTLTLTFEQATPSTPKTRNCPCRFPFGWG